MGGRIDCYIDIASFYSYVAFAQILKNRHLLAEHGVEIDIHPVLIGAINVGSGNRPPWALPAKAAHLTLELGRAARAAGLPPLQPPSDLFARARTQIAMRALLRVKELFPPSPDDDRYLAALAHFFRAFWALDRDLTTSEGVAQALREVRSEVAVGGDGGAPVFSPEQVADVVRAAGSEECKVALKRNTEEALRRGAFGCPWFWVADGKGREEPFFGSDRWHFIYEFLGLPYHDVALLPPGQSAGECNPKL